MRTLVIGDIHGCLRALETLVAFVPLRSEDRLITLGDYVDRGPDSKGVLDWIIERTLEGRCIPLLGNHEIMMLDALNGRLSMTSWLGFGGRETLASYAYPGRTPHPRDISDAHLYFLSRELRPWYESESHIFVHASLEANLPLTEQPNEALFWNRCDQMQPHQSGKHVIVGHSAQRSGEPLRTNYFTCIDTWVYGFEGWLTCLDVESGEYWQASERGETRQSHLSSLPLHE